MDIKLSKEGCLSIYRDGKWKEQFCPYDNAARCGDWCPLFSIDKIYPDRSADLYLCHARYSVKVTKEESQ